MKLSCALLALPLFADAPRAVVVDFEFGQFAFDSLTMFRQSTVAGFGQLPEMRGRIVNRSKLPWTDALFSVRVSGHTEEDPQKLVTHEFDIRVDHIWEDSPTPLVRHFVQQIPYFVVQRYDITFKTALEVASLQAEKQSEKLAKEQQRRAEERQRHLAAQHKKAAEARRAFLSKFPTLQNGAASVFIGADQKCASQFVKASTMDGLEKRKLIADLLSYGCGFIVGSGTHVSVEAKDQQYARVKVMDGELDGKSGWVPVAWVKAPIQR